MEKKYYIQDIVTKKMYYESEDYFDHLDNNSYMGHETYEMAETSVFQNQDSFENPIQIVEIIIFN